MLSSDDGEIAKPQTSRSVSLLSPEQLKRKRTQDRESQRQTRERVKNMIKDLESQVESMTRQLQAAKLENAALQSRSPQFQPWSQCHEINSPVSRHGDCFGSPKSTTDPVLRDESFAPRYQDMLGNSYPETFIFESPMITAHSVGTDLLDPSLISHAEFPFEDVPPSPLCIQVWEARPIHLPPTCRLDKIFIDIIESRRMFDPVGANALEFSNTRFPSVAALLNPEHHAASLPLTTAIVTHVIYVLTISTLPEQIAIMYVMCTMMRWQITGSKKDYDALPEWLRPGAAQLVTGHPAWVDVFPWPKAREAICQNFECHGNWEYFKTLCNQSISVNWPYEASDTLIAISDTEYVINPVFMTHIRTLGNWTLGLAFVEAFPDLAKHVKVSKPRGQAQTCS